MSTDEQKAEAVKLVGDVGSIAGAARDQDPTESVLHAWVKQAEIEAGKAQWMR